MLARRPTSAINNGAIKYQDHTTPSTMVLKALVPSTIRLSLMMVGPVVSSLMAHDPALEGDELGSGYGMAAGRPPAPPLMVNHQPHRRTRLRKPEVRNATYGVGAKYTMREGVGLVRIRVEQRSNWGGNKPGEERVRGSVRTYCEALKRSRTDVKS
ncbi:hypothetical protein B0H14DRAFT_2594086 [Mycena olivaceomarginata]|nr:hypothetical protein B0H14DRAFT_2594086 [Mycena olivaceomarginata]